MVFFSNSDNQVHEEVEQMLTENFGQQVSIKSSGSLGGGCINNASKLDTSAGTFFLKWNASGESDMFLREAEGLKELKTGARETLIVPEVFAAKEIDDSPGFLVLEHLETASSSPGDDQALGRGLATIHKYSSEKFGFYNDNYCGSTPQNNSWTTNWVEFFRDNRLGRLLDLIQKDRPLSSSDMSIYHKLLDKIPQLLPSESTPALIHGDLWSGNYMMTGKGPALIDPATYYADREMEMGIMTMFGGFSRRFYDAYNEVNRLPSDWKKRNALYQLYHVLNHYYLFGGGYGSQAIHIAKSYV